MEKSKTCPKCAYSSVDEEFSICPKCGVIVKKYYETQDVRLKMEKERANKKQDEEEQERIKKGQTERERLKRQQEERRLAELKSQEEDRERQIRSWKIGNISVVGGVFGFLFLAIGTLIWIVGSIPLFMAFYYFSGVLFICAAINTGFQRLLIALADIHNLIKAQNEPIKPKE
jgi:cation transport ATPase